jgi:hypothetical protein
MRIIFKLLFGLGKQEVFEPTLYNIMFTALMLLAVFLGGITLLMYLFI